MESSNEGSALYSAGLPFHSSNNTNPPGVSDGAAVLLCDLAHTRNEESVAAALSRGGVA
jgi:hypothetical protein